MRALVVDDSESVRTLLAEELTRLGFEVSQAENGLEALEVLAGQPQAPDVALVDRQMPLLDGPAFIQAARRNPRYDAMQIVLCCPPLPRGCEDEVFLDLIQGFLPKPITRGAVAKALDGLRASARETAVMS